MRDGSGNGDLGFSFENVESRGTEFAFAANDFVFAEAALDDGAAIELEECTGHAFENGDLQQIFGFESLRVWTDSDRGAHHALVGERTGGTGDHALATGDAGGIPHRRIEIERDAGGITLAHAAQDEIAFDFVAAANAAVAENAGVVVDGDGQGRIVLAARDCSFCEARLGSTGRFRVRFQFAVAGIPLARARRRAIGHHEFKERVARAQNFFGIGDDFHAGLDRADARSGEDARAGVHDAEAADAHGSLVLQMAKCGDVDAVHARRIEDASAGGHADGLAVESNVDHSGRCEGGCHFRVISIQFSVGEENILSSSACARILLQCHFSSQLSVLGVQ